MPLSNLYPLGEKTGFVFAYFFSSTLLFLALSYLGRLPAGVGYFHILGLTFGVAVAGELLAGFFG